MSVTRRTRSASKWDARAPESQAMKPICILPIFLPLVSLACGPSAPSSFPRESAASTAADEAPVAPVGLALKGDPPLPGHAAGWAGLDETDAGAMPEHHHHMPGMDMSATDGGTHVH